MDLLEQRQRPVDRDRADADRGPQGLRVAGGQHGSLDAGVRWFGSDKMLAHAVVHDVKTQCGLKSNI